MEQLLYPARSQRAKRLSLRVNAQNRFILTIPNKVSYSQALKWAESKAEWIQAQLAQLPELRSLSQCLERAPFLACWGRRWKLVISESSRSKSAAKFHEDRGVIELFLAQAKPGREREQALYRWIRGLAQQCLKQRLDDWADHHGLDYNQIRIGDQATRWGSCSSRKTISLNWRLLLISPQLQDAVILHELAHLSQMNHSVRFWSLLEKYDANYAQHHAELKRIARQILAVRACI